ncbi:hypothetical protein HPB49_018714 [Dermacentor silvarum]|uniref:Uncharacterized protein n=1 Tax=Dermacentor silvarum TaxID=543639 RepID=A0ACB8CGY9_DERSI|nr:hypothetical protein HPB49_018714 [Dermacentor silvarum]
MGISWALFLIGHHQREQQLIHEELDSIFGDDRERHVTTEDLKHMKYLECALKECQRIYPSVPMITRACTVPFTIGVEDKATLHAGLSSSRYSALHVNMKAATHRSTTAFAEWTRSIGDHNQRKRIVVSNGSI